MSQLNERKAPSTTYVRAAVKRCCAAWQRAYDATMSGSTDTDSSEHYDALRAAKKAYCDAMPFLLDYQGICAFMACLSHGIVIGAVPPEKSGRLTYNAQVALSTIQRAPKPPKTAKPAPKTSLKKTTKPTKK
jgi:hypothetical protein